MVCIALGCQITKLISTTSRGNWCIPNIYTSGLFWYKGACWIASVEQMMTEQVYFFFDSSSTDL